jgi:5,10-methylenetetrahydromethanopterin reductase
MTEIAVLAVGDCPPAELTARAVAAEELGYDAFWIGDERFFMEPFQLLALCAQATSRIRLGPCIIDPYTIHPALGARLVATLDRISNGRAVLVLGAGKSGFREMGIERVRSAARLKEAIELIRTLFQKGEADYQGEIIQFHSGRMNLPMRPDLPIWVATEGRITLEMAGARTDAVMVSSAATPERIGAAVASVAKGARRAGRPRPKIHVRLDAAISEDRAAALDRVRFVVLRHLIANLDTPEFVAEHELDVGLIASLKAINYRGFSRDGERAMRSAHLVPDRLIRPFMLAGAPADITAQIAELAAVVEGVTVYPLPIGAATWRDTVAALHAAISAGAAEAAAKGPRGEPG